MSKYCEYVVSSNNTIIFKCNQVCANTHNVCITHLMPLPVFENPEGDLSNKQMAARWAKWYLNNYKSSDDPQLWYKIEVEFGTDSDGDKYAEINN